MKEPLSRRRFMEAAALGAGLAALSPAGREAAGEEKGKEPAKKKQSELPTGKLTLPVAISTWKHGVLPSRAALRILQVNGSPLDAVENGINLAERDPEVDSVGVGGLPNEEGDVELDAAIMEDTLRCGAVLSLRDIATPISVARRVMDKTRHVQLAGDGALQFAIEEGFETQGLLTPKAKARWEEWKAGRRAKDGAPKDDAPAKEKSDGHDTIAMLVLSSQGRMAAGCSTSGLAWKMPGRVGDSPIIGAGLYCDGEAGAAGATGVGEEVLRVCGSFLIVEGMRRGLSPQAAVNEALRRVTRSAPQSSGKQVAFIALSRSGEVGAGALQPGFQAALAIGDGRELLIDIAPLK